jgi:hypothetical protein
MASTNRKTQHQSKRPKDEFAVKQTTQKLTRRIINL